MICQQSRQYSPLIWKISAGWTLHSLQRNVQSPAIPFFFLALLLKICIVIWENYIVSCNIYTYFLLAEQLYKLCSYHIGCLRMNGKIIEYLFVHLVFRISPKIRYLYY